MWKSLSSEAKAMIVSTVALLVLLTALIGPAAISRATSAWYAQAYGSDWLVVLYAQDGSVINSWELANASIASETQSDGIYFKDNDGNVVHLSGHYVYIQVNNRDALNGARDTFVNGRRSTTKR